MRASASGDWTEIELFVAGVGGREFGSGGGSKTACHHKLENNLRPMYRTDLADL
jgi:hypothetical protein